MARSSAAGISRPCGKEPTFRGWELALLQPECERQGSTTPPLVGDVVADLGKRI